MSVCSEGVVALQTFQRGGENLPVVLHGEAFAHSSDSFKDSRKVKFSKEQTTQAASSF